MGSSASAFGEELLAKFIRGLFAGLNMSLDNETGMDPPGIRVRHIAGLVAADYFAPGYFVWAILIINLAQIGYEEKTMYMVAYDWRLSFQNTEIRDQSLSRIKTNIELMVATNGGNKVVVIPHSMGVLCFLHFMEWVETAAPMGGPVGHIYKALIQLSRLILLTAERFVQTFLGINFISLHFLRHGFLKFCNVKKESIILGKL